MKKQEMKLLSKAMSKIEDWFIELEHQSLLVPTLIAQAYILLTELYDNMKPIANQSNK